MAVQVVGTLLLFALVVTPAATALAISARPVVVLALGTAIGLASVWLGLTISAMFNLPPSFCIVSLATLVWIGTLAVTEIAHRRRFGAVAPRGGHAGGDHHHREPSRLSV
jgi:zinc/manganese transport system permease protein